MVDVAITLWLNSFAGKYPLLDIVMIGISFLGLIVLAVLAFATRNKNTIAKAAAAFLFATIVDFIINLIYFRPRPFVALPDIIVLQSPAPTASFPSRHAITAFSFVPVLWKHNKKLGIASAAIAALVGISRIYLGMHYVSDVLGGLVLGLACGWVVEYAWRQWQKRK